MPLFFLGKSPPTRRVGGFSGLLLAALFFSLAPQVMATVDFRDGLEVVAINDVYIQGESYPVGTRFRLNHAVDPHSRWKIYFTEEEIFGRSYEVSAGSYSRAFLNDPENEFSRNFIEIPANAVIPEDSSWHADEEDGHCYIGYWKDGQPHGWGIWKYVHGDRYVGELIMNKRNGKGKYTLKDGRVLHDGLWKDDKEVKDRHSDCSAAPPGPVSPSDVSEPAPTRPAGIAGSRPPSPAALASPRRAELPEPAPAAIEPRIVRSTGTDGVYVGEWTDDMRNGIGRFEWTNGHAKGAVYVGGWKDNKMHGTGTMTWPDEKPEQVRHEHGKPVDVRRLAETPCLNSANLHPDPQFSWTAATAKPVFQRYHDGVYTGYMKDGKRHGLGVFESNNGNGDYAGDWRDDEKHGQGKETKVLTNVNGNRVIEVVHDGEWRNGKPYRPSKTRKLAETSSRNSEDRRPDPQRSWIAPVLIICALYLALLCCYLFVKRQNAQTEAGPEDLC